MEPIIDDMGFEVLGLKESMTNEEWNEALTSHGRWLIEVAAVAADDLYSCYNKK